MTEIIIKSECVSCNKPIENYQAKITYETQQFTQEYHASCYEDMYTQILREEGWSHHDDKPNH